MEPYNTLFLTFAASLHCPPHCPPHLGVQEDHGRAVRPRLGLRVQQACAAGRVRRAGLYVLHLQADVVAGRHVWERGEGGGG